MAESFNYESVDLNEKLTEDVVFEQLSDSFIVLENLINGAKNSKDNLEKIYELLNSIKTITTDLKESVVSIQNINSISDNMSKLDKTLKEWVNEEVKMISALNSVLTEQKSLKELIHKSNKKRIVDDISEASTGDNSGSGNLVTNILLVLIITIQVVIYFLKG